MDTLNQIKIKIFLAQLSCLLTGMGSAWNGRKIKTPIRGIKPLRVFATINSHMPISIVCLETGLKSNKSDDFF